jgi:acyl-CoA hydrolase
MPVSEAAGFAFHAVLRPGDRVVFGQACSEPVALLRELLRQAAALHSTLGRIGLFVAGSYSGLLKPEHSAWFDFSGYGAIGDSAALARAGRLDIHPVPYSQLPALLAGELRADVVLLQLSKPDALGRHSLGAANDFQLAAARQARVVVAEVNEWAPFSPHALLPADIRIAHIVSSDEPLVEAPRTAIDAISEQIAAHVAGLIQDGATLQMGVGSLPDAICHALGSHRDLGIHSGILTEGMAQLLQRGAATNARKGSHAGQTVVGSLLGTRKLFDFADGNPDILLAETHLTHGADSLRKQLRFCSINSAVEVDLTGQVNAEVAAGRYVGAVGGQPDFIRAAACSEGGLSIIALPSSAGGGKISRIVDRLSGPVTTPRSDIDCVVTEWGVARLRGCSLRQRAKSIVAIAHPEHREALSRAAQMVGC